MTDREAKEALRIWQRGERLAQSTIKRLFQGGYIEVEDVTSIDSTEQELVPTFLTLKGQQLLESER
jgi:hypothetical protein